MRVFERLTLEQVKELLEVVGQSIMRILDVNEIDKYDLEVDKVNDQVDVEFYQWDRELRILCTFAGAEEVYVMFRDMENVSHEEMKEIEQVITKTFGEIILLIQ